MLDASGSVSSEAERVGQPDSMVRETSEVKNRAAGRMDMTILS
jgi:hypothetical protein